MTFTHYTVAGNTFPNQTSRIMESALEVVNNPRVKWTSKEELATKIARHHNKKYGTRVDRFWVAGSLAAYKARG